MYETYKLSYCVAFINNFLDTKLDRSKQTKEHHNMLKSFKPEQSKFKVLSVVRLSAKVNKKCLQKLLCDFCCFQEVHSERQTQA